MAEETYVTLTGLRKILTSLGFTQRHSLTELWELNNASVLIGANEIVVMERNSETTRRFNRACGGSLLAVEYLTKTFS